MKNVFSAFLSIFRKILSVLLDIAIRKAILTEKEKTSSWNFSKEKDLLRIKTAVNQQLKKANIQEEKRRLREKIWKLMEEKRIAIFPLPPQNRIPNFRGSEKAARLVTTLPEWKKARTVFVSPDSPQKKIRKLALKEGKILIIATPKLKEGYLKIDPRDVKGKEKEASTIAGAFRFGKKLNELPRPDLIIIGCVAVDRNSFYRLGKGGGYGDREIRTFISRFGKIPVITTVHELQIVEGVPHDENDTLVDCIVTPDRIIRKN